MNDNEFEHIEIWPPFTVSLPNEDITVTADETFVLQLYAGPERDDNGDRIAPLLERTVITSRNHIIHEFHAVGQVTRRTESHDPLAYDTEMERIDDILHGHAAGLVHLKQFGFD